MRIAERVRAGIAALVVLVALVTAPRAHASESAVWEQSTVRAPLGTFELAYDTTTHQLLSFAPQGLAHFDGTSWSLVPGSDEPPYAGVFVFDRKRGVPLIVGARTVMEWTGAAWVENPAAGPDSDVTAAVFDETLGVVVALAGTDPNAAMKTWLFDGAAWAFATTATTASPRGRIAAALTYDRVRKRAVLFGGITGNGSAFTTFLGDTWEWDSTTSAWNEAHSANAPSPRATALAYDEARRRTVLFAGRGDTTPIGLGSDTWEWDGQDWTETHPPVVPQPRGRAKLAYDEVRRRIAMLGGKTVDNTGADVWLYWTYGAACTAADSCDTSDCDHGRCCATKCGPCERCDDTGRACELIRDGDDAESCPGDRTCDAAGACRAKLGRTCTHATDCASGECTRGICCARCAPYACGADGACKNACARDEDCAAPALCQAGQCALPPGSCTSAHAALSSAGEAQECAPYACDVRLGACLRGCTTSDECADGFACDRDGACRSPLPKEAGGGCAAAPLGDDTPFAVVALVAICSAFRRRRGAPRGRGVR